MASNFDPYQNLQSPSTSLNLATTAPQQTDIATDDDDSDSKNSQTYKEKRREAHTAAEQKRRDAIKKGYDSLQDLVPTCQQTDASGHKVVALQIMRANYEQLVKAHQRAPQVQEDLVSDEMKFQVFQIFLDSLFQSFNQQVSMNNFAELSGCVFSWIEEQCKPGDLQELMYAILKQTNNINKDPEQEVLGQMGTSEPIDPAYQRN
eukprot:GFUD01005019.1.p1 GENE.GFUD01005019.1~~GFUD01005019.1.p1  ORF type:complete len:205 (+),score=59.59 GFUD01005019.1:53-667(+)